MQEILVASASKSRIQEASNTLNDRSLIYEVDDNQLYINYHGLRPCYYVADNITLAVKNLNGANHVGLADNAYVKALDVSPDNIIHSTNALMAQDAISSQNTIYLMVKASKTINETVLGEMYRLGENISEMYNVSISSKNKSLISGSSSLRESVVIKKFLFNDEEYYGIKFNNDAPSSLYFHGFSNVSLLSPPLHTEYTDDQITVVEENS